MAGEGDDGWGLEEVLGQEDLEPGNVIVYAADIEPKLASTLVRELGTHAPLPSLQHVKRVRRLVQDNGSIRLSVILCTGNGAEGGGGQDVEDNGMRSQSPTSLCLPQNVQEIVEKHNLHPFVVKVPARPAHSRAEWEAECRQVWPTSFHPNAIPAQAGAVAEMSDAEVAAIKNFMEEAVMLAVDARARGQLSNAAVIVDPALGRVVASGCDETGGWPKRMHATASSARNEKSESAPASASASRSTHPMPACGALSPERSVTFPCARVELDAGHGSSAGFAPCALHRPPDCSCGGEGKGAGGVTAYHPLRHAVMVAIDACAKRDLLLFPTGPRGRGGAVGSSLAKDVEESSGVTAGGKRCGGLGADGHSDDVSSSKRLRGEGYEAQLPEAAFVHRAPTESAHDTSSSAPLTDGDTPSPSVSAAAPPPPSPPPPLPRSYLCTGFDLYTVQEPCAMCCMAMVHQRLRRVFFSLPNVHAGGLESSWRIHTLKSLNHHFMAYKVSLPRDLLCKLLA